MRKNIEKFIQSVVEEFVKNNILSDIVHIEVANGKTKGEGYLAKILKIDVYLKNGNKLNMLAKIITKSETNRLILPIDELHENELQFYEKILPTLANLQEILKVQNNFDSVPKFYTSGVQNDQHFIVLENLKEVGYVMFDFQDELDEMHCRKICEIFGKFHAVSFLLKHTEPEKYNGLIEKLHSIHLGFMRYKGGFLKMNFRNMQKALGEIGKRNRMIDYYVENVECDMRNIILESRNDPFSCILHCDGWTNNFMFKYEDFRGKRILKDVKLIDWQNCYVGSPVLDLSYFLYAGAPKRILDNMDVYLRFYHKSLTDSLADTRLKLKDVYPFDVLKQQWRKYCGFGVILGFMVTKIRMSKLEEVADGAPFEEIVNAPCCSERLSRRIEEILEHLESDCSFAF